MRGHVDVCFATFQSTSGEHWETHPPFEDGDEVVITPEVRISRLTEDLRSKIDAASQPRHYNIGRGVINLTYGIVRENASSGLWDADHTITRLLALSRIVHPSTLGGDSAGKIRFTDAGEVDAILGVIGLRAYGLAGQRPWLTKQDAEDLAKLFNAHEALPIAEPPARKLPRRLHRALWNFSYAAQVPHFHIRWLIVATALEGVVETDGSPTQEFIERVTAISSEVGAPISRPNVKEIYRLRSRVAHLGWMPNKTAEELEKYYWPLDRVVAGILRRALFDEEFRKTFENKESHRPAMARGARNARSNVVLAFLPA